MGNLENSRARIEDSGMRVQESGFRIQVVTEITRDEGGSRGDPIPES
jgi:hypothetical protein